MNCCKHFKPWLPPAFFLSSIQARILRYLSIPKFSGGGLPERLLLKDSDCFNPLSAQRLLRKL